MRGVECYNCTVEVDDVELGATEGALRLWSNPSSWTSGACPVAGENITIDSTWNMVFDLVVDDDSEVLDFGNIEING